MANWTAAVEVLPELFGHTGTQSGPPAIPTGGAPPMGQTSHEIDYEIFGDDMQIVEVELDPGETVIAEPAVFTSGRSSYPLCSGGRRERERGG